MDKTKIIIVKFDDLTKIINAATDSVELHVGFSINFNK
jgi:hypothetical protein